MLKITVKTEKNIFNLDEIFDGKLQITNVEEETTVTPKTCKCKSGYDISDEIGTEGKLPFRFKMSNPEGSIEYINKQYYDELQATNLKLSEDLNSLKTRLSGVVTEFIEKLSSL